MAKAKPKKTSALSGAVETDVEMMEGKTSTSDVTQVHVPEETPQLKPTNNDSQNTRGKRGKGDYVQLCVHIPKELKKPFRHAVVENDLDNSKMIEKLIRDYLAKNST